MNVAKYGAAFLCACIPAVGSAATITYVLPDIGTFTSYQTSDATPTFTGNGFVGLYSGNSFAHLLGMENSYSKTDLQQNISALSGTINSATLTFQLLDGDTTSTPATATNYASSGTIAYNFSSITPLGTAIFNTTDPGTNSVNVTALLQARVSAGAQYFALQLQGNGPSIYQWTYTAPNLGFTADRAALRLAVDYTPLPEPSAALLVSVGWVLTARRRRA